MKAAISPESGSVGVKTIRAHRHAENYFLRWRILARILRFLRPIFRRPLPVLFVPTESYSRSFLVEFRAQGPGCHFFRI